VVHIVPQGALQKIVWEVREKITEALTLMGLLDAFPLSRDNDT